jgi:hypothetical protein
MADRTVQPDKRVINPMFPIPDGLVGYSYGGERPNQPEPTQIKPDTIADDASYFIIAENQDSGYSEQALEVPEITGIINQIVHVGPTGQQVVDLLVEVEDQPGVEYEIQAARA